MRSRLLAEIVVEMKAICKKEGLTVYGHKAGTCRKHDAKLEKSGGNWLCWDCQIQLAELFSKTKGCKRQTPVQISSANAAELFGADTARSTKPVRSPRGWGMFYTY